MARRPGRAKWGEAPARTGRRAMPLGVSLSEGLGVMPQLLPQCVDTGNLVLD